jgi:hypothetical protein
MLRRIKWVVALGAALVVFPASGAEAYNAYPTCSTFESKPAKSHVCRFGSPFGAVLIAKRQDFVDYRLCVRGPGPGFCVHRTTGRRRNASKIRLFSRINRIGTYRLKWKTGRKLIDADRLVMQSEGKPRAR